MNVLMRYPNRARIRDWVCVIVALACVSLRACVSHMRTCVMHNAYEHRPIFLFCFFSLEIMGF